MNEEKKLINVATRGLFIILFTLVIGAAASASYYIGDFVWYDSDGDGIQDEGEPGVADVTVNIYDCQTNEQLGDTAVTDVNGGYQIRFFVCAVPDNFYLEFTLPEGSTYSYTIQDQGLSDELDRDVDSAGMTPCLTWATNANGSRPATDYRFDAGLVEVPEEPCGECKGKVSELTLLYTGTDATVRVEQKAKKKKNGSGSDGMVFQGDLGPGQEFTFVGTDKGTLGTEISLFIDGALNTKIHTSCSQPIYPGLTSGLFEVVEGYSLTGGLICPLGTDPDPDPDPLDDDCECKGKVTQLTLQYTGISIEPIIVTGKGKKNKKTGEVDTPIIFFEDGVNDVVATDGVFTIIGSGKDGKLGTDIYIHVGNDLNTTIHTSCSQPIGIGLVSGDFIVLEGFSAKGGKLCPL